MASLFNCLLTNTKQVKHYKQKKCSFILVCHVDDRHFHLMIPVLQFLWQQWRLWLHLKGHNLFKTNRNRDVMALKWQPYCRSCCFKCRPLGSVRVVATGDIMVVLCRAISTIPIIIKRPRCLHSSPQCVFHKTERKPDHNPDCLVTFSSQLFFHMTFPLDILVPVIPGYLVTEVISVSSAPSTG